ncbi:MAG: hypothetical protein ABSB78_14520 [Bacteroidota bacterium]
MTLLRPDVEDKRKIHAEITQISNQRFLMMTVAITIFGITITLLLPKTTPVQGTPVGPLIFFVSTTLVILLFVLYVVSHLLKCSQRVYTTYLIVTKASNFETDWKRYREERKKSYFMYTKPQTIVFIFLNIFTTIFPVVLAMSYSLAIEPVLGLIICLIVGVVTCLLMYLMGYQKLWDLEAGIEKNWTELNKKMQKTEV